MNSQSIDGPILVESSRLTVYPSVEMCKKNKNYMYNAHGWDFFELP